LSWLKVTRRETYIFDTKSKEKRDIFVPQ